MNPFFNFLDTCIPLAYIFIADPEHQNAEIIINTKNFVMCQYAWDEFRNIENVRIAAYKKLLNLTADPQFSFDGANFIKTLKSVLRPGNMNDERHARMIWDYLNEKYSVQVNEGMLDEDKKNIYMKILTDVFSKIEIGFHSFRGMIEREISKYIKLCKTRDTDKSFKTKLEQQLSISENDSEIVTASVGFADKNGLPVSHITGDGKVLREKNKIHSMARRHYSPTLEFIILKSDEFIRDYILTSKK